MKHLQFVLQISNDWNLFEQEEVKIYELINNF